MFSLILLNNIEGNLQRDTETADLSFTCDPALRTSQLIQIQLEIPVRPSMMSFVHISIA